MDQLSRDQERVLVELKEGGSPSDSDGVRIAYELVDAEYATDHRAPGDNVVFEITKTGRRYCFSHGL